MNTQAIIDRMNELGLNYRTLAAKVGVSAKVLQNAIEERDIMVFADTLKVVRFLGLSLDAVLLGGKTDIARNTSSLIMAWCKAQDWELPDFAAAAGLNINNVRNIVSGSQRMGNGEAVKIAQTVGLSLDEFARVCTGEVSVESVIDSARRCDEAQEST